jgi:hypothetical protein
MGKGNQKLLPFVTARNLDGGRSLSANLWVCSGKFLILSAKEEHNSNEGTK